MSRIPEFQHLPDIFIDYIKHIIFDYLSVKDLRHRGLIDYLNETKWENKVKSDFNHVIAYPNSKSKCSHDIWSDYYYLDHMIYEKAQIVKLTPQIAAPLLQLKAKNLKQKYGIVYEKNWKNLFSPEIYNLMKDLEDGDIVVISEGMYFFISVKSKHFVRRKQCKLLYAAESQNNIHLSIIAINYPVAYWSNSNIPELDFALTRVKITSHNNYYRVINMDKINSFIIFVENNIAYAILDDETIYFTSNNYEEYNVAPLSNYPQFITLLKTIELSRKDFPNKISILIVLEQYNLSWNRIMLTRTLLTQLL